MAQTLANEMQKEYSEGKGFIETDWTGTPEVSVDILFSSKAKRQNDLQIYECVSIDISLSSGLRFKTKARM